MDGRRDGDAFHLKLIISKKYSTESNSKTLITTWRLLYVGAKLHFEAPSEDPNVPFS